MDTIFDFILKSTQLLPKRVPAGLIGRVRYVGCGASLGV